MVFSRPLIAWRQRLGLVWLTALAAVTLGGWDTAERAPGMVTAEEISGSGIQVFDRAKWNALYRCHLASEENCRPNEHAWLADRALRMAAPQNPWGLSPRHQLTVNDLNGAYFRPEIGALQGGVSDPAAVMGIPQRVIPGAANWAGIPDISYTIYDWINKNELCPPVPQGQMPAGTPGDCHNYFLWQGGAFNSSHFGSQATRSYQQLHGTALWLARRAASLRSRATTPADLALHADAIREAEQMALAYEGYAQHFLQDRWALGHMFERWGAPEYHAGTIGLDASKAVLAGGFTGIVHGHQSVTGMADALSSPEIGAVGTIQNLGARFLNTLLSPFVDEAIEVRPGPLYIGHWRHDNLTQSHPGVGDYRAWDMIRGRYEAVYSQFGYDIRYNGETELPVGRQQQEFLDCSAAGFREVIESFGPNPDGGFGYDRVTTSGNVPASPQSLCFDIWATNESIVLGYGPEFALAGAIADIARADITFLVDQLGPIGRALVPAGAAGAIEQSRLEAYHLTRAYATARLYAFAEPEGAYLAQGGFNDIFGVPTGDTFPVASYLEPSSLSSLPEIDPRGRDARTVFGFFNRAHADYFCRNSEEILTELRGSREEVERGMCRILAQRIYQEVGEGGYGEAERLSVVIDGERQSALPLCEIAIPGFSAPRFGRERLDELHPGYVAWDFSARTPISSAHETDPADLSYQSVANWCDEVPVIDYLDPSDEGLAGVSAVIEDTRETITLTGLHLGDEPGELRIGASRASAIRVDRIEAWSNQQIRFTLEEVFASLSFNDAQETFLFVTRAAQGEMPASESVGRFAIRHDLRSPEIETATLRGRDRVYYAYTRPGALADPALDGWIFDQPPADDPAPSQTAFWPIPPGESLRIELRFTVDIDRSAEGEAFTIDGTALEGRWTDRRTWRGLWTAPDGEAYDTARGGRTLSINVRSARGPWIDGDLATPGHQPDTQTQFLLDRIPAYVETLAVRAGGRTLYQAEWTGGPRYQDEASLSYAELTPEDRQLSVSQARPAPPTGMAELRLTLSQPVEAAPMVWVAGVNVPMDGREARWRGRFDLAAADSGRDDNGDLPVVVTIPGRVQDSDPRTATVIGAPPGWESGVFWYNLESERGSDNAATGGPDTWHKIGPAPALSFLIILDGSGSMSEHQRMETARAGIAQMLAGLPADRSVEIGGLTFHGCGNFQVLPFTRDLDAARSWFNSITPDQGTALAWAHRRARAMFASLADPRSAEWRFTPVSDGLETCNGDVVGEARALQAYLDSHRAPDVQPDDAPPVPSPTPLPTCEPATWRGYRVEVADGGRGLDQISLVEHAYLERTLPDGRCLNQYQIKTYGVYYASLRARSSRATNVRWGINSSPSETETQVGGANTNPEGLASIRAEANRARGTLQTLSEARTRINTAVEAAARESG